MILAGLALSLILAWLNFLLTAKWAAIPGALNGPRWPWYGAALLAATVLTLGARKRVGLPVRTGRVLPIALAAWGAITLAVATFARLPPPTWSQIPLKDDWTELYQQAVNGVRLLHHGAFVGWNWWLQGGYPTSTDIGQNLAALAFIPMTLFGDRVGYHVLHVFVLFALPVLVWWDLREDGRGVAAVAGAFAALFTSYYLIGFGNSGDTNSLMGVFCATMALAGSGAARRGKRSGGLVLLLGLTLALYSHPAFFVYGALFVAIEAAYFRDRAVFLRLCGAAVTAAIASLPIHWESLRYHAYTSFNNAVYDPSAPIDWPLAIKTMYYNVEILALPHRWFNDYRSLANVWLPALAVSAFRLPRSRAGFYVWATLAAQLLLRFNTAEVGAVFDRIQHMLPIVEAPALAAFVLSFAGTRSLAAALAATIGIYVPTTLVPIRHVESVREWDPALIDRIAASDGNMTVVEISPHRDMDRDPSRRSPRTPFDVHFEGLLPDATRHRFYSQMIDGWVFNVWRGEVVAAGTWRGEPIDLATVDAFAAEMRKWGVKRLFVWTDRSRGYLTSSGRFVERWRGGLWSEFEMLDPSPTVSVSVSGSGHGSLRHLNMLGGEVLLDGVAATDTIVV
ncbi:MAG TPA: hypothetical protein VH138_01950, partial [Vicinamibacterales bacterium]|nr:hypothetical protein [Vicinamibacterales bacterium]